jgi:pSer/pThr/pTyr-binding forkhead associated (FHA) protein
VGRIWVHRQGAGPTSQEIGDGLLIGRGDHCDLMLDDATVSTDHVEISRRGVSYLLTDLDSSNGTLLNGRKIRGAVRLDAGDVVQIGRFRIEIDIPRRKASTKPRDAVAIELTEEEREVVRALVAPYREEGTFAARHATRREIAEQLNVSESTVKRRIDAVAIKLRLVSAPRDRMRMVADRAIALGLDQL